VKDEELKERAFALADAWSEDSGSKGLEAAILRALREVAGAAREEGRLDNTVASMLVGAAACDLDTRLTASAGQLAELAGKLATLESTAVAGLAAIAAHAADTEKAEAKHWKARAIAAEARLAEAEDRLAKEIEGSPEHSSCEATIQLGRDALQAAVDESNGLQARLAEAVRERDELRDALEEATRPNPVMEKLLAIGTKLLERDARPSPAPTEPAPCCERALRFQHRGEALAEYNCPLHGRNATPPSEAPAPGAAAGPTIERPSTVLPRVGDALCGFCWDEHKELHRRIVGPGAKCIRCGALTCGRVVAAPGTEQKERAR